MATTTRTVYKVEMEITVRGVDMMAYAQGYVKSVVEKINELGIAVKFEATPSMLLAQGFFGGTKITGAHWDVRIEGFDKASVTRIQRVMLAMSTR